MNELLLKHFDLLATAPGGVARLRELILTLAVQGKLVPQDPTDEPASVLLQRIRAEKDRLIAEGKIKRDKPLEPITDKEKPFELPQGWEWVRFGEIAQHNSGKTLDKGRNSGRPRDYITTSNLYWGRFELINLKQMLISDDELERCTARKGDLLICEGGEAGRAAVWAQDFEVCFQNHIHRARLFGDADPYYAYRTFQYLNATGEIDRFRKGVGISNMSSKSLASIPITLPPLREQSRIVARVEELMRLCDALEAKGQLDATQHAQLLQTLLGTLADSTTPEELAANWQRVATHFDLLLDRPAAVDALEQTILQLAVRGLLVPQDPNDEPASMLLQRIRAEKDRLIAEGKIKRDKPLPPITDEEKPFELPYGWEWARLNDLIRISSGDGLTAAQMTPGGTIPVFGGNGINGHHDRANVDEPTLVIGRVGYYCGSVHITPQKAWVTDNAFITRYPKAFMDLQWLFWLLVGTDLKENDSATAQPVISGRKLYPIVVALPPLAEQARIVARVEQLRQLCAELRQRLTASRTTQGHLAEALIADAVSLEVA